MAQTNNNTYLFCSILLLASLNCHSKDSQNNNVSTQEKIAREKEITRVEINKTTNFQSKTLNAYLEEANKINSPKLFRRAYAIMSSVDIMNDLKESRTKNAEDSIKRHNDNLARLIKENIKYYSILENLRISIDETVLEQHTGDRIYLGHEKSDGKIKVLDIFYNKDSMKITTSLRTIDLITEKTQLNIGTKEKNGYAIYVDDEHGPSEIFSLENLHSSKSKNPERELSLLYEIFDVKRNNVQESYKQHTKEIFCAAKKDNIYPYLRSSMKYTEENKIKLLNENSRILVRGDARIYTSKSEFSFKSEFSLKDNKEKRNWLVVELINTDSTPNLEGYLNVKSVTPCP